MMRTNRVPVFWFFLLVFSATMSGTIASSDGHTMMLLTRSLVDRGALDVPEGNTLRGLGGRNYPKAGVGQALLGVPLYFAAERAAEWVPPLAHRREPFFRFVLQLLGPLVSALLCVTFLGLVEEMGVPPGRALLGTLLLGLATPVWVYSKTYLSEPWTAWLLLAALAAAFRYRRRGGGAGAAFVAGLAVGYAVVIKAAMVLPGLALGLYFLDGWVRGPRRSLRELAAAVAPLAACLALVLLYNHARFGRLGESGYGLEQTARAYSTPIYVGLYGQLLGAGKSLFLFAPPLLLLFACWRRFQRAFPAEGWTILGAVLPSLILNSCFHAWAGDGSWGPRYLIPFVPLLMIPVAAGLAVDVTMRRVWAPALLVAGMLVQWGGVSIYYGSYLREMGAYPYTRSFDDPRFLEDVHWVPEFSPVVGHWRMFRRNLDEHLHGDWPRISLSAGAPAPAAASGAAGVAASGGADFAANAATSATARIPLSPQDQGRLLHGLDFWFLYLMYLGVASTGILLAPVILVFLAAWALVAALRACARAEAGA